MKKHKYTAEEIDFIKKNLRHYDSYKEFGKVFNDKFLCNVSPGSISDLCCKRIHYPIGKNKTKFQTGHREKSLPIGTIRKANGATYIKVADTLTNFNGYKEPDWMPLQKKIWIDANGPIRDGEMVCFLDCNRENFALENLYCIDRKIAIRMANNGWWSENRDITLAGIKYIELCLLVGF